MTDLRNVEPDTIREQLLLNVINGVTGTIPAEVVESVRRLIDEMSIDACLTLLVWEARRTALEVMDK